MTRPTSAMAFQSRGLDMACTHSKKEALISSILSCVPFPNVSARWAKSSGVKGGGMAAKRDETAKTAILSRGGRVRAVHRGLRNKG